MMFKALTQQSRFLEKGGQSVCASLQSLTWTRVISIKDNNTVNIQEFSNTFRPSNHEIITSALLRRLFPSLPRVVYTCCVYKTLNVIRMPMAKSSCYPSRSARPLCPLRLNEVIENYFMFNHAQLNSRPLKAFT